MNVYVFNLLPESGRVQRKGEEATEAKPFLKHDG